MLQKALRYLKRQQALSRINLSLARAATTSSLRQLQSHRPNSWEFAGFSQNGEDGISDYLTQQLLTPNHYFFEIGAADGLENNTSWFAIAKKYQGMMIEGNPKLARALKEHIANFNLGVDVQSCFVTKDNAKAIVSQLLYTDPDLFSIDIDGNDYYVLKALLNNGLKPKIIIVEYNSAFGPTHAKTIPYQADFHYLSAHASGLYYGVSIKAWQKMLQQFGYQFVTVESNGVNAFFIDPKAFDKQFIDAITSNDFVENFFQLKNYGDWKKQSAIIQDLPTEDV